LVFIFLHNYNCFQYVGYGDSTYVSGEEYLDTVTLNSDLVIDKQSTGIAENGSSAGLPASIDGIFGLGPVDLTQDTVSNAYQVPTVMDNLYEQKTINSEVLGVFFSPASNSDTTGELTFGGYDASKITGSVSYVPITSTSPASGYWGIDQSLRYGTMLILSETAGIIDTGATFILIATGRRSALRQRNFVNSLFRCLQKISFSDRCHL
jgi:saccharopepsin